METVRKLSTFEDPYIDPETGEILDEGLSVSSDELPDVARQLLSIDQKLASIEAAKGKEINRLMAFVEREVEGRKKAAAARSQHYEASRVHLMLHARAMMDTSGQDNLKFPGYGTFGNYKVREKTDVSAFKSLPPDERVAIQNKHKDCFVAKTTVQPDLAAIKSAIKQGDVVEGCAVTGGHREFEFKAEG